MPKPYASGVVAASIEAVWELVRPFDGLPQWHPTIAQSSLSQGAEGQVFRDDVYAAGITALQRRFS